MGMLPEEFPVVLTVLGYESAQVLTRRAAAIETLGSATVLCTDKTGTLRPRPGCYRRTATEWRRHGTGIRPRTGPYQRNEGYSFLRLPRQCDRNRSIRWKKHDFVKGRIVDEAAQSRPIGSLRAAMGCGRPSRRHPRLANGCTKGGVHRRGQGCAETIALVTQIEPQTGARCNSSERFAHQGVAKAIHKGSLFPKTPRGFAFVFLGLVASPTFCGQACPRP